MTWPLQSPDLNPLEMVWDKFDCRVKENHTISAQHLWEQIQDSWKTIPGNNLMKLIERVQECTQLSSKKKGATLKNLKYIVPACLKNVLFTA